MQSSVYSELAKSIIEHQESIVGPVAVDQAKKVSGLNVDWSSKTVVVDDSTAMTTIDNLVEQYKVLFGQISVEVCKEAVGRLAQQMTPEQMPASLR